MTSWNGLLRKEWVLMRWSMIAFIVAYIVIAVSSFAPVAVGGIVDADELISMFSTLFMFFGAALFLQSLHTDMKQPDVWLHTPASIWRLLGVKVTMAIMLITVSFLIWSGSGVLAYLIGGFAGIVPSVSTLVKVLVNTILIISASLLIWVIYMQLRVRIGWFAGVVLVFFICIGMAVWSTLLLFWEIMGLASSFFYGIVSIVLFASGAILLEKKVRY